MANGDGLLCLLWMLVLLAGGREDQQCRLRNSADDEARDVSSDAECDCNVQTLGRSAAGAERAPSSSGNNKVYCCSPGHPFVEFFEKERTRIPCKQVNSLTQKSQKGSPPKTEFPLGVLEEFEKDAVTAFGR